MNITIQNLILKCKILYQLISHEQKNINQDFIFDFESRIKRIETFRFVDGCVKKCSVF